MKAILHSERNKKNPKQHTCELLTLEDYKALSSGSRVYFVSRFGTLAQAKVTSVKTWKTRPGDVDVNLKYGLYEFFCASFRAGERVNEQLVRIIPDDSSEVVTE
jgi:hypothetical protein